MKTSKLLSTTFHPASFAPAAVRRRELIHAWLVAAAVVATLATMVALVIAEGVGGTLFGR